MKITVLLLCLLVLGFAQDECEESRLFEVQTGEIMLNPNDLGAAGANKNYFESLERGEFEAGDFLGYAFAIAGFETSCEQDYFSLMVDVVEFQSENTRMRVVIDFRNPAEDALTVWTKVKLTYLVASATRYETTPVDTALIWATNAEIDMSSEAADLADEPVLQDDIFYDVTGLEDCGLLFDAVNGFNFYVGCGEGTAIENDIAVHAYIMGFQFNPDSNDDQFLAASVDFSAAAIAAATNPDPEVSFIELGTVGFGTDKTAADGYGVEFTYGVAGDDVGPHVDVSKFGEQLETIKIGFVFTVLNPFNTEDTNFNSPFQYSYSGLYQTVDSADYNIQTIIAASQTENNLYEQLPTTKYAIYGLSSFELADSAGCSSFNIEISIPTPDSFLLTLDNSDSVSNVMYMADIYSANTRTLCTPIEQFQSLSLDATESPNAELTAARDGTNDNLEYLLTRDSEVFVTVPSNTEQQNILQLNDNPLDVEFNVNGVEDDETNVVLTATIVMDGITDGNPYGIRIYINPIASTDFHTPTDGSEYQITLTVDGNTLYNEAFTAAELDNFNDNLGDFIEEHLGINLSGSTATFVYTLTIPRNPNAGEDYTFEVEVDFFEFDQVYDPVTECCVEQCPEQTGLNVGVTPPTCVECDTSRGLVFNTATGSCACDTGFYLDANLDFQCFPCETDLCETCDPENPDNCETCIATAEFNSLDNTCTCRDGYYQENGTCVACPSRCATCTTGTVCSTCADEDRDADDDCSCPIGFFDSGASECQACNPSCATCSNSTTCLTCDPREFRTLSGSACVCEGGFYELAFENGTRSCLPCSPECANCSISASECTACDSSINRIEGYDSLGRRTCICRPGFSAQADASCVQSDCNSDPFCSECEEDLALCIQCQASVNRVIKLPEHICVCEDGYYEDANNVCQPCSEGCAQCTSASDCQACVAQATNNNDGTCSCAEGTFFTISTNDVRYCDSCIQYCDTCINPLTCQTCAPGFTLATDGTCVCPRRNFINPEGNCVPCKSGCDTCTNANDCSRCVAPLVVENDVCVVRCSEGFFLEGTTCVGCPENCVACTAQNQCFYCADDFFLHAGSCYSVCPSGTVADTTNFRCVPCNTPCRTCHNHPSSCTSCEPGEGYLQITDTTQSCVKQCAEGTFPMNNVCEVCNFQCARCLGFADNCIACPAGRFLYNGACWDFCPGVTINDRCIDSCPSGYYRFSDQECRQCSDRCETCDNNQICLTCKNNQLALNGECVADCGAGYYAFRGFCVACDQSCATCQNTPTQCVTCAAGYVRSGSRCVNRCQDGTYLDTASNTCQACSSTCLTCSSQNLCTSCPNVNIVPVGGQCLSCIYPCETCSEDLSVCFTCLSGFSLSDGECVRTCPTGSRSVNGVCTCASGIFLDGVCVSSCPSGYTNVNGTCQRCISPCAECTGNSASFCTDCLENFMLNPNTGVCEQASACNFGQEEVNGQCERICEPNYFYQDGACIFGGCPTDYKDNGFGGCVVSSTTTNRCQVPTFRLNGICVEDCGNTFFPDSSSRTCKACAANCQTCLSQSYCFACATGFTSVDGRCVAQSDCPSTQFSYNGDCVISCPSGTYTENGRCIRSCPLGSYYYDRFCYNTCPLEAPLATETVCVTTCPAGTVEIDGVCGTIV